VKEERTKVGVSTKLKECNRDSQYSTANADNKSLPEPI
jgi:hypothetical protein